MAAIPKIHNAKQDVNAAIKKMKKKKSSGYDGLSQEHMAMGADILTSALLTILTNQLVWEISHLIGKKP